MSRAAITRADRRRRRDAKRAEIRARGELVRFVLAWAGGEMDGRAVIEFENERHALMLRYRAARQRLALTLAGFIA